MLWHRYWYSDLSYSLFLQQDNLLALLLKTYLKYGSHPHDNFYSNLYWINTKKLKRQNLTERDYRRYTVYEEELNYTFKFRLRKETPETFESKLTILRFNKWFILSISWFQPNKRASKAKSWSKNPRHLSNHRLNLGRDLIFSGLYTRFASLWNFRIGSLRSKKQKYLF